MRNWKRWKRRIGATALSVIIAMLAWWGIHLSGEIESLLYSEPQIAMETLNYLQNTASTDETEERQQFLQSLNDSNKAHRVVIQRNYICGQEERVMGQMSSDKIIELLHHNPTWKGHFGENEDVWLTELIEDLSPVCKQRAYMSMDANGNLTLYEGPPKQERVLKTFFQLDINSMESALPEGVLEQLYDGIRIQDLDEYNSVISTFSDFAQEYTENVMKRTE
ncbi:BofC C-terminal domain-containing protein [Paenibacillus sp. FA6]|uniref:BofC C-terminal domain-containing protein n=1 Tax=Paenibacillus sp. FA6 TaxID=3413029 RepID=UPI003F65ACB3